MSYESEQRLNRLVLFCLDKKAMQIEFKQDFITFYGYVQNIRKEGLESIADTKKDINIDRYLD